MSDVLAEVAPGVLVATAERWSTTCTVVVSGPHGLIVDPGITAAEVSAVADGLDRHGITPVGGFSTHPHWDHLLWSDRWPVPRWATPDAVAHATTRHPEIVAQAQAETPGHAPTLAGLTALPQTHVPWPGPPAVVVTYPGHCPGSAALLVADLGVIVLGDMLSDTEVPLLDVDAADPVGDYARGVDVLVQAAERSQVTVAVPGHGNVCDLTDLSRRADADLAYLKALSTGQDVDDPRLADPWVGREHLTQVHRLAERL